MNKIIRCVVVVIDTLLAGTCGYCLSVIGSWIYIPAIILCAVSAAAAVLDV